MLEKIGLPAKPSMRGSNWVVDASHCQGCSSQFTFFNRKHHCRRCGGLFCNSCTSQRMILRGQGDSPVRICDPCKKLEEAARFEMRYGHRNRDGKGGAKLAQKPEVDVLNEILGSDGKKHSSARESGTGAYSDLQRAIGSASCSNLGEGNFVQEGKEDTSPCKSIDMHMYPSKDKESSSPEELRQLALEEKNKYRTLKRGGKSDEALKAFKRSKELERQAVALDLELRKRRRHASTLNSLDAPHNIIDDCHDSSKKNKLFSQAGQEEKYDLVAELRELGWSDTDMHDADKKSVKKSLEGELSSLFQDIPKNPSLGRPTTSINNSQASVNNSQILILKKKALAFKREGKLAEAKEELKRAKILEKQLEEQELLAEGDESDDELSSLIQSMDEDDYYGSHKGLPLDFMEAPGFDVANLVGEETDLAFDGEFNVTDDDMNDPEIAAALKSFGWTDDADPLNGSVSEHVPVDAEALRRQMLLLKKEALKLKHDGNVTQAMEVLKKAKKLEHDIEKLQADYQSMNSETGIVGTDSVNRTSNQPINPSDDGIIKNAKTSSRPPLRSKIDIQRELLSVKKKALALRREGLTDEAEEELKKGKVLEHQLEALENASKSVVAKTDHYSNSFDSILESKDGAEEDANVTEHDMHDPALLSILKTLGWEDEEVENQRKQKKLLDESNSHQQHALDRKKTEIPDHRAKSKAEIQKELLSIKRKALALRRQGKSEEAEEELSKAKFLEAQMAEMEVASKNQQKCESGLFGTQETHEAIEGAVKIKKEAGINDSNYEVMTDFSGMIMKEPEPAKGHQNMVWKLDSLIQNPSTPNFPSDNSPLHEEMLAANCVNAASWPNEQVNALQLSTGDAQNISHLLIQNPAIDGNAGGKAHSEALLNLKADMSCNDGISSTIVTNSIGEERETSVPKLATTPQIKAPAAPESIFRDAQSSLQQEVLAVKRKAVALKREGKLAEAREELRQAKLLEKSLGAAHLIDGENTNASASASNVAAAAAESNPSETSKPLSSRDRFKLQQESLGHKRQALKLRREGRMEESEAEFDLAKALEIQLEEMGSSDPHHSKLKREKNDDVFVEDLLDSQLLSALKGIGMQDLDVVEHATLRQLDQPNVITNQSDDQEKGQLEQRIKAEKVRALQLKRAGQQAEALDALRRAKQLEKKLSIMSS